MEKNGIVVKGIILMEIFQINNGNEMEKEKNIINLGI